MKVKTSIKAGSGWYGGYGGHYSRQNDNSQGNNNNQ